MQVQKWLNDNELSIRIEPHGYTADGWLWVADFMHKGQPMWIKENPQTIMVQQNRGWGKDPTTALMNLAKGCKGWWLVAKYGGERPNELIQVPTLDLDS
jgi:hypothetical protein